MKIHVSVLSKDGLRLRYSILSSRPLHVLLTRYRFDVRKFTGVFTVDNKKITSSHNEYTVAGSLQITLVKQEAESRGVCEFATSSGYSGGSLGQAEPLPGGDGIRSKLIRRLFPVWLDADGARRAS